MAKDKDYELPPWEIIADAAPPYAALEYWAQKSKLPYEEVKKLGEEAMYRAFYVTGLAQHDLVQLVSDGLQQALENGETLADFKARILSAIQSQGWHDHRVENIFRTNMQTAYMAGRYKKMQQVKESRPYWQYIAVLDKRVRPSHAILHEKVYPADHEFWSTNYPPNGFRCRCTVRTLSEQQVKTQGLTVETEMPKDGVWTDPRTGMEYFVHFPGADKGFQNNPGKDWYKAGLDLQKLSPEQLAVKPKKEPVTQKKLQADIDAIDGLIGETADAQVTAELEAKKKELQEQLEKKKLLAAKKKIGNQTKKLDAQISEIEVKAYSGIWPTEVTTNDWLSKADSIPLKKQYFQEKLSAGGLTQEEVEKLTAYLADLDEFDAQGKALYELKKKREDLQNALPQKKKNSKNRGDPYSKERKDAALWFDEKRGGFEAADAYFDPPSKALHASATKQERDGFYTYTSGSGGHNRPLAGFQKPWSKPGSGWEEEFYVGPGKVWIDYEGKGEQIRGLTTLIQKSMYDKDVWLQSGQGFGTMEGFFGLPRGTLEHMSDAELQRFVGSERVIHQFLSTAVNKGGGGIFNSKPMKINIYAPKGSQMLYASDVGAYGKGENEMILQRGGTYKVTKIYWGKDATDDNRRKLFVDLEIHPEKGYDLFQQDPNEWKGPKENFQD